MTSAVKHTAATAREHILSVFRTYNTHDPKAIVALFTDDVEWSQPMLDEPVKGRAAAQKELEATFRAMPDLHIPLDDVEIFTSEDGRKAISAYKLSGTMTGPMDPPGFAPTGRKAEIFGTCVYEFRGGLISRHFIVFDGMKLAQDLGLLPRNDSIAVKAMVGTQRLAGGITKGVGKLVHR